MKTGTYAGRFAIETLQRVVEVLAESRGRLLFHHHGHASCLDAEDWRFACALGVNVVLMGRQADTRVLVKKLRPLLPAPVVTVRCGASSGVATSAPRGTVVLEDVNRLGVAEQRRLLVWLGEKPPGPRVICTTSVPIVPLIETGAFLASLYYRLNTIYCEVTAAR
jgi:hypothetical protein